MKNLSSRKDVYINVVNTDKEGVELSFGGTGTIICIETEDNLIENKFLRVFGKMGRYKNIQNQQLRIILAKSN